MTQQIMTMDKYVHTRWSKIFIFGIVYLISVNVVNSREVIHRIKRDVQCEAKFRKITNDHSACKPPSPKLKARGLEDGDIKEIVNYHNQVRREVSPTASFMMKMTWDDGIARIAQGWADNCITNHDANYERFDYGRYSVGQNLAWGTGKMGWTRAIKLWADEKPDYDYYINNSPSGRMIGHYTQMVWATSHKIGCGYAHCGDDHYYVCNYGPGGNTMNVKPYVAGNTCSSCSNNCENKLCNCGDKTCFNDGTLDPNTCTCSCVKNLPFYLPSNCGLNCTSIEEPSYCKTWGRSACRQYTNVPTECPDMCGWCPAAEYNWRPPVTDAGCQVAVSLLQIIATTVLFCILF